MADIRPASATPAGLPARPLPAARAEAIRAAQRAFFDQALASSPAAPPRAAAQAAQAAAPVARAGATVAFDAEAPRPTAPLRPGSLLDIKV